MQKLKKGIKGITLIALVVTIIVLLILASIGIYVIIGNNGIIKRAEKAKEKYEKAIEDEQEYLEDLYSSIKIADSDDAEITIKMKELKNIIDERINQAMSKGINGIKENSTLMSSHNEDKSVGEKTLKDFTNTFTQQEFEKYFEYNETTGELICKQDGWYLIWMRLINNNNNDPWNWTALTCYVNGKTIFSVTAMAGNGSATAQDSSSTNMYLMAGDKITITKTIRTPASSTDNVADLHLIKN